MADLGDIQYTNVNSGTRQVDRSAEARAIAQGLGAASQTIKAAAIGKADAEMEEALIEGIQEATPETVPVDEFDPVALEVYGMTPEQRTLAVNLANDIRRAEAAIAQASTSGARTAAVHRLRRAQQEMRQKFGMVGSEIDAVANRIITSSPELLELQVESARIEQQRALSQDFVDRVTKEAYEELAIPTRIEFGTPEFVYEYMKRSEWRDRRVQAEQHYNMLAKEGQFNSMEKLNSFKETALSEWSPINTDLLNVAVEELRELDIMRLSGASDAEMATAFEAFKPQINELTRQAMSMRRNIESGFTAVWAGEDTESKEYKGAVAIKEQLLGDIDLVTQMLEQGDVKIVDYIKAQQTIRQAGILEMVPSLRQLVDIEAAAPGIFNTIRQLDVTHSSTAELDMIARGVLEDMNSAGLFMFNKLVTDPYTTGAAKDAARQRADRQSATSGTATATGTVRDKIVETVNQLNKAMLTAKVAGEEQFAQPALLSQYLDMVAPDIARLYEFKTQDRDMAKRDPNNHKMVSVDGTVDEMIDWLAGDTLYTQYAKLPVTDPGRDAMAHNIEHYLLRNDQDDVIDGLRSRERWNSEIQMEARELLYGKPFIEYLEFERNPFFNDDRVSYRLNEEALAKEAAKYWEEDTPNAVRNAPAGAAFTTTKSKDAFIAGVLRDANLKTRAFGDSITKYARLVSMTDAKETNFMYSFYRYQDGTKLIDVLFPPEFPHEEVQ